MTKLGLLPQEWEISKLGDVAYFETGKRMKGGALQTGEVISLGGEHIGDFGNLDLSEPKFISQGFFGTLKKGKLCIGDVIICKDGAKTGKVAFINKLPNQFMAVNEHIFIVRSLNADFLCNPFVFFFLRSELGRTQVREAHHGLIGGITNNDISNFMIPLPPFPEQKAIARVLSIIQKAIETQDKIIAAARELKKSLMRHLFTYGPVPVAEADKVPLKETKIGTVSEHWRVVRLGDTCTISTGTTPSTHRPDYYQGTIPFIKTNEIINNLICDATIFINEQAVKDYNLKIYKPGTIFLAMYGQGKTRGQVALLNIAATTTQNTAAIQTSEVIESKYLWLYLMSQYEVLRSLGHQGQISHLNIGYVKQISVPLPSLPEQQEIAHTLMSVDKKIKVEENRKTALQALFKTMLHQLITGKVRVKELEVTAA